MTSPKVEPTSPPSNTETADETPMPKKQRKPRAGARSGASKDCFQCLKSGSTCDRQRPYCGSCVEKYGKCPGYTTQLTWDVGVASRGKMRGQSLPILMSKPAAPALDSPLSAPVPATSTQPLPAATSPPSIYGVQQPRPRMIATSSDSGPAGWEDTHVSPHEESAPDTSYHSLQREHIHNSCHRIKKRRASPPYSVSSHSSVQLSDMPQIPQANLVHGHTLASHLGGMQADQQPLHGHWSNMDGYPMMSDGSHGLSQQQQQQQQQHQQQQQQHQQQQQQHQQQHQQHQQQHQHQLHQHQHQHTPTNVGSAFSSPGDQSLGDTGYGGFTDGVLHIPQPQMQQHVFGGAGSPGVDYMCDGNSWVYTADNVSNPTHSPVAYDVGMNSSMGVGIGMGMNHGLGHGLAASASPSASMALSMSSASSVDMSAGVPAGMELDMNILMGVSMEPHHHHHHHHHHHQQVPISYPNTTTMDGASYYAPVPSTQPPTQYVDIGAYDTSGIGKW